MRQKLPPFLQTLDDANFFLLCCHLAPGKVVIGAFDSGSQISGFECRLFDLNVEIVASSKSAEEYLRSGLYMDGISMPSTWTIRLFRDPPDETDDEAIEFWTEIELSSSAPGRWARFYWDKNPGERPEAQAAILLAHLRSDDVVWRAILQ